MAHLAAKAVRKVLFAIAHPRAIRSDRVHAKTPWKQDLPLKVGRICLFLIAARDHRFGVRGGEQSDVQWRDQSGRELLRRQAYGRRGCGAGGKIPVFGLMKRAGKVQDHPKRFQRHPDVEPEAKDRA